MVPKCLARFAIGLVSEAALEDEDDASDTSSASDPVSSEDVPEPDGCGEDF